MDTYLLLKFGCAFVFVISLMYGLSWAVKKSGMAGAVMTTPAPPAEDRLFLPLDARRCPCWCAETTAST